VEQYRNDYPPGYSEADERTLEFREILFGCVLRNATSGRSRWLTPSATSCATAWRTGFQPISRRQGLLLQGVEHRLVAYEWAAIPGTIACGLDLGQVVQG